jgi:hypothetical protein
MDDRPRAKPISLDQTQAFVAAAAAAAETILGQVEGLGATLVVTATRVIVVRQGAHFRPRSGVRAWPIDSLRAVQLVAPRNGNGRVVLRTGPYPWQAVSLFIAAAHWRAAERAVSQIRVRIAGAKRGQTPLGRTPGGAGAPAIPPAIDAPSAANRE